MWGAALSVAWLGDSNYYYLRGKLTLVGFPPEIL